MCSKKVTWHEEDSGYARLFYDYERARSRAAISSHLKLLHSILSDIPGGRRRFCAHRRIFAALHRYLPKQVNTGQEVEPFSLGVFLHWLAPQLQRIAKTIPLTLEVEDIGALPLKKCLSFLVVLNELVANAEKHGAEEVLVSVRLLPCPQKTISPLLCLEVSDRGEGFPKNFEVDTHAGLGFEIVQVLCRWDLEGELIVQNKPDGGARVQVYFPFNSL